MPRRHSRKGSALILATVVIAAAWMTAFGARAPLAFAPAQVHSASAVRLQSTSGARATVYDQRRLTLVVFGYARCVEVCPRTLAVLAQAALTSAIAPRPRIVLVDVDWWHDSLQALRHYVAHFKGAEGLSGDRIALVAAQRDLGAHEVRDEGDVENHDARVFILDTRGFVLGTLQPPASADEAAAALRALGGMFDKRSRRPE